MAPTVASWRPGEPAYLSYPQDRVGSMGDDVAEVAVMMRRPLDAHQLAAVDVFGSYGPGGRWSTLEGCIVGPRQTTGKTSGVILPTVCHDLLTRSRTAPARCIWTSHRMKTTLDTFRDLKEIIEGSEEFSRRVARISEKDGDEAVYFTNRSWLEFAARSAGAGRGLASEIVVVDEALYFMSGQAGDLLPAMASKSNPRVLYGSSAAKGSSDQLHALMARGRSGDPTLGYIEFRCPGSLDDETCEQPKCDHSREAVGCRLDDEGLWPYGSPGLANGRCSVTVVRALRRALEPLEFAREMLGWEEPLDDGVGTKISPAAWSGRGDRDSSIVGAPVLTLDVALDRSWSCIAAGGYAADGRVHVEVTAYRPGTGWVVGELARLEREHGALVVALDPKGPPGSLLPELEREGVNVVTLGLPDQVAACGALVDAVKDGSVVHMNDPVVLGALASSVPRDVGDGWAWGRRKSAGDISPLVAITEAYWQATLHCDRPGDGEVGGWWV